MANTLTVAYTVNSATHRQLYITLLSDGTQATNTIIYDPTTTPATTSGAYVGTKIRGAKVTSSVRGAAGVLPNIYLDWDASTPVAALSVPCNSHFGYCASLANNLFAPIVNQGGSGVTGKIGITTLGLVAGDTVTVILDIING